jgi:uncharacterized SAM-binding protein YcdF (DUF218 family)
VTTEAISRDDRANAETLWTFHQMGHELKPCSVGIGLGSHDIGVATLAAKLYHEGYFGHLVFTGANSATTRERFPHGEAVHFRDHAIDLGVPPDVILVEDQASNTGQNITFSKQLLDDASIAAESVMLISKPYMQRRAYATCRKVWPEVEVTCASEAITLDDYIASIGNERLVIDMIVGDVQRIIEYPRLGYAIEQPVPDNVHTAYQQLIEAGFTARMAAT